MKPHSEPVAQAGAGIRVADGRVAWTRIDSEVIVLDLEASEYFRLNRAGGLLWETIATSGVPLSVAALVETLVAAHHISEEQATADVRRFLERLDGYALLET